MEPPMHLKHATLETLGYICEEVVAYTLAQDQATLSLEEIFNKLLLNA